MSLYLPTETAILAINHLPVGISNTIVLEGTPMLSYSVRRRNWFGQFVATSKIEAVATVSCTNVHFSDGNVITMTSGTRILCKTNDSDKYYTVNAGSLKPGMICASPQDSNTPLRFSKYRRYVLLTSPTTKPPTIRKLLPEIGGYIVIDPGIIVCTS